MKILKKVILVAILALLIFSTSIYAADISLKIGLTVDKQTIKQGEQITLTVKLKEFQGTGNGINSFKATFNYDKNIFKEIELENGGNISPNIESLNRWDQPLYNPQNNELVTSKGAFVKTDEDIIKIKLTVKPDAKIGNTTISLQNISTSDGTDLITIANTSVNIQVISSTPQNPDTNETNETNIINKTDTNKIVTNKPTSNIVATGALPQTGTSSIIAIAITIIVINAVIAFVKYRNTK